MITSSTELHLITQYHQTNNSARQLELNYCLEQNLVNPYISKIHLLTEYHFDFSEFSNSYKIQQTVILQRLSFQTAIQYANSFDREKKIVWILSNADIYFNDSINNLYDIHLTDTVFALTRHDINQKGAAFLVTSDLAHGCQDSWVFKAPLPVDRMFTNFLLGIPGCDNRIAHEFVAAGYLVANPSLKIIAYHLDLTRSINIRERTRGYALLCNDEGYRSGKVIAPPYQYCLFPTDQLVFPDPSLHKKHLAAMSRLYALGLLTPDLIPCGHLNTHDNVQEHHASKQLNIHILIVLHSFFPQTGGVECYAAAMASALSAMGCRISLFYPVRNEQRKLHSIVQDTVNGFNVFQLTVGDDTLIDAVTHKDKEKAFNSFLQDNHFDLFHFHHTHQHLPFSFIKLAKETGKPVCLTLHDFWFICMRSHLFRDELNEVCTGPEAPEKCCVCFLASVRVPVTQDQVNALTAALAFRQSRAHDSLTYADLISAPSEFVHRIFAQFGYADKSIVLSPLGVVTTAVPRKNPGDAITFGYIGSISPIKNLDLLLGAFKRTSGKANLLVYGQTIGAGKETISKFRHEPRICFKGEYQPEDLPVIFSQVDIIVVPSHLESYCLTVREALAAGIPVIAANRGGIPEAVIHGVNGILFDPDNDDLSLILQSIIDKPSILNSLTPDKLAIKSIEQDAEAWLQRYRLLTFCA